MLLNLSLQIFRRDGGDNALKSLCTNIPPHGATTLLNLSVQIFRPDGATTLLNLSLQIFRPEVADDVPNYSSQIFRLHSVMIIILFSPSIHYTGNYSPCKGEIFVEKKWKQTDLAAP
jgi:hypothetical protein